MKLEHVGIAVNDAEAAASILKDLLGARVFKREFVQSESVETFFVDAGGPKIELLQTTDQNSALAKFLKSRGEGLHHLAFEVEDIDATFERVSSLGFRVLSDRPYTGADGKSVFFIHPKDSNRILLEFCQTVRPAGTTILFEDSQIEVVGNPSGPKILLTGIEATNEIVRLLEPLYLVHVIPDQIPITDRLVEELLSVDVDLNLICFDPDPSRRIKNLKGLNSVASTIALLPSSLPLADSIPGNRSLVVLDSETSGHHTKRESLAHLQAPEVSLSIIPLSRSDTAAGAIIGRILLAFLAATVTS